jgi:hypothetical protein
MYSPGCKDPRRLAFTIVEISYGSGEIGPEANRDLGAAVDFFPPVNLWLFGRYLAWALPEAPM